MLIDTILTQFMSADWFKYVNFLMSKTTITQKDRRIRVKQFTKNTRLTDFTSDILLEENGRKLMLNGPARQTESESEHLLSQYKFARKLVLRCTVTNRTNNRLINTATKAKNIPNTHSIL